MTLIVILNAALALGIVGAIVALHSHAIVRDHRHHHGHTQLWSLRARPVASAAAAVSPRPAASSHPVPRRRPAAALD